MGWTTNLNHRISSINSMIHTINSLIFWSHVQRYGGSPAQAWSMQQIPGCLWRKSPWEPPGPDREPMQCSIHFYKLLQFQTDIFLFGVFFVTPLNWLYPPINKYYNMSLSGFPTNFPFPFQCCLMSPMTFPRCEGHPPEFPQRAQSKCQWLPHWHSTSGAKGARRPAADGWKKWKTLGRCTNSAINPYRESCFNVGTMTQKIVTQIRCSKPLYKFGTEY